MQALAQLQQRFQGFRFGEPTEEEAQWFLRDRSFDVDEAEEKLATCLRWRAEFGLNRVTWQDVAAEAATGKAYLHEHVDKEGRPALVVRVAQCALPLLCACAQARARWRAVWWHRDVCVRAPPRPAGSVQQLCQTAHRQQMLFCPDSSAL